MSLAVRRDCSSTNASLKLQRKPMTCGSARARKPLRTSKACSNDEAPDAGTTAGNHFIGIGIVAYSRRDHGQLQVESVDRCNFLRRGAFRRKYADCLRPAQRSRRSRQLSAQAYTADRAIRSKLAHRPARPDGGPETHLVVESTNCHRQ